MEAVKINLGKVSISVEKDYWDIDKQYDRLTIVERAADGNVYLSRKPVPAGTSVTNREYWICFGKPNNSIVTVVNELGTNPESAIAQQIVTREINKLKNRIARSLEDVEAAIAMLSPEQQEAIGIAQEVVKLKNQLNSLSLVTCTETEYNQIILDGNIDENTLYFIEEELPGFGINFSLDSKTEPPNKDLYCFISHHSYTNPHASYMSAEG